MLHSQVTFKIKGVTLPDEVFAVCGNCAALGNWYPQKAVFLEPDANDGMVWSSTVCLPRDTLFQYRYFKCSTLESKNPAGLRQVLVNTWETHPHPRSFNPSEADCILNDDCFGTQNGVEKLDSGWLTCQSEIRLRLHYSDKPPVLISKKKFKKSRFRVKLTLEGFEEDDDEEKSLPTSGQKMANTLEISLISNNGYKSRHSQPDCGYALENDQWTEYSIQTMEPDNLELIFDFFEEELSETVVQGDALPGQVGSACLLSSTIVEKTSGIITLPIMSRNSRQTIGKVNVDYVIIKPMQGYNLDMSPSISKYWKPRMPLDVGHRGAGNTTANLDKVRENTIASFKNAARHGAAFVEFDVQISKDYVPIVYHDLTCCISMKKKADKESAELLEIPVKELTFEQLQLLKLAHVTALKVNEDKADSVDEESNASENQPFPSLKQVLKCVPERIGFNIEIKWPYQQRDGVWEGNMATYLDMNHVVDIILKCVLENAGNRRIVFSSFICDVCSMFRQKQNKYPVLFLTQGYSNVYPELMDLRGRTTSIAMSFAQSENLLGINVHTEDLLRNLDYINQAKSKGLVIFCWGDDTNESENRRLLKESGIDGLIYDKICDSLMGQTSIFRVEEFEDLKNQLSDTAFINCSCSDDSHFACLSPLCNFNGSNYPSELKPCEQEASSIESDSGQSYSSS